MAKQETDVLKTLQTWCSKAGNIAGTLCQSYCKKDGGAWCDDLVAAYCKANPNNTTFCGCYNYPSDVAIVQKAMAEQNPPGVWDPTCYLTACRNNAAAYKSPAAHPEKPCPALTICSKSTQGGFPAGDFQNMTFGCPTSLSNTAAGTNGTTTNSSGTSGTTATPNKTGQIVALVFVVILIAAIIISGLYFGFPMF